MERALKPPPTFSALFSIGPVQESVFSSLTMAELLLKVAVLSSECNDWAKAELLRQGSTSSYGIASRRCRARECCFGRPRTRWCGATRRTRRTC